MGSMVSTALATSTHFAWRCIGSPPFPPPLPKRGPQFGTHPQCWLCGGPTEGRGWPHKLAIPETFTNHTLAVVPFSDTVCEPCVAMSHGDAWRAYCALRPELRLKSMQPLAWRSYSHVFADGFHACPTRAGWRQWLVEPPQPPFLFVITESGQKHTLFRARVAYDREVYPVQVEEDTLVVARQQLVDCLADFEAAYAAGLSKETILTGRYPQIAIMQVGLAGWQQLERAVAPWRSRRPDLMRLAAFCAQRPATATEAAEEEGS